MVVVGLGVCHLIRTRMLEWYLVPSRSMEPTLHGHPVRGDLVLVDKTAFWRRAPERYDLVVVRGSDDPHRPFLVKRAVAFGDGSLPWVSVIDGDLFLGRTRQLLQRDVKHPVAAGAMRVTHFELGRASPQSARDYFAPGPWRSLDREGMRLELDPAAPTPAALTALLTEPQPPRVPAGHLSTARPIDTTFLDAEGERRGWAALHRDIGVEFDAVVDGGGTALQIVIEHRGTFYSCGYGADGALSLTRDGVPLPAAAAAASAPTEAGDASWQAASGPPLRPEAPIRFTFGYLDGWFFVEVAGVLLAHIHVELPQGAWQPRGDRVHENAIHIGVAGGRLRLSCLRTFHDVYYRSLRGPIGADPCVELAPGSMFLLGDNSRDSHDSRMGRTYSWGDLVGRPIAIIGPPARMRWL